MNEKYYRCCYDRRLGGAYCEVYDDNLNLVRIEKGAESVHGLFRIAKKSDVTAALHYGRELNDEFNLLFELIEGSESAAKQFVK